MLKKWLRARFLFESVLRFAETSLFYKTLKSTSVCKSWNYCTSASSDHDLLLIISLRSAIVFRTIMSKTLSDLVNNQGFYIML